MGGEMLSMTTQESVQEMVLPKQKIIVLRIQDMNKMVISTVLETNRLYSSLYFGYLILF